jgi:hypothetical protein
VVSVLLDAGAGDAWKYTEESSGVKVGRSEGLALASLEMFKKGLFSGVKEGGEKYRVNGKHCYHRRMPIILTGALFRCWSFGSHSGVDLSRSTSFERESDVGS